MTRLAHYIDTLNHAVGKAISWITIILIAIMIIDVFLRYVFSITSSASFELEWHLFAALFMLSAGWTLQQDRHVRVDVFYQRFSPRRKAWIDLTGTVFMLLPLCVVGFIEGLQFTLSAYYLGETSPDPGGLPARFVIKSVIPLGFLLLAFQGISMIITNFFKLMHNGNKETR